MPASPYFPYIQMYFPQEQWENADCISLRECDPTREGYPSSCVAGEGLIDCGQGPVEAKSWGIFQILDACWSPYLNPDSPFTKAQWDKVLDPNINTWMASVIWSRGGWRAWTTCPFCQVCQVPGGAIPHPEGPVLAPPSPIIPPREALTGGLIVLGIGMLLGAAMLLERREHGKSI